MFLLRCAFWLSVVYASMSWAPGTLAPVNVGSSLVEAGRSQTQSLVASAAARATDLCARHARECIAEAARLTALISATDRSAEAAADEPKTDAMPTATIPLPVPDPRRHVRDAKLARAP